MNGRTVKELGKVWITHATGVPDQCLYTRNISSETCHVKNNSSSWDSEGPFVL